MRWTGCLRGAPSGAWRGLLAAALLGAAIGAAHAAERATVVIHDARFEVEVMRETVDRERGLMHRRSLAPDQGMLFVFEPAERPEFWMKNVHFALDILFIDTDGRVRKVHADVPPCVTHRCPTYAAQGPTRYVLEVPAGAAARLGVTAGTAIRIQLAD